MTSLFLKSYSSLYLSCTHIKAAFSFLLIYFWLHWVLVVARGLSLLAAASLVSELGL